MESQDLTLCNISLVAESVVGGGGGDESMSSYI